MNDQQLDEIKQDAIDAQNLTNDALNAYHLSQYEDDRIRALTLSNIALAKATLVQCRIYAFYSEKCLEIAKKQ